MPPPSPPPPAPVAARTSTAGLAAVAVAAGLWAAAAVVARRLFDDGVPALQLVESRSVIALVGFALLPGAWRRPARTDRWWVAALGLTIALVNLTYYEAIARIPVAVALVLQYTAPGLVVAWTGLVGRQAPSPAVVRALAAATVGVVLVVDLPGGDLGRAGGAGGAGVLLALAAAVFFAAYTLLAERVTAAYGPSGAMLRSFAVTAAVWLAYQAPQGLPDQLLQRRHLPEVLYVGVLGTLAPFLLFVWGVHRVQASRAAIGATLEPVLAAVMAWVWLDQGLAPLQVAGGVLVLGAVVSLQMGRRRPLLAPEP